MVPIDHVFVLDVFVGRNLFCFLRYNSVISLVCSRFGSRVGRVLFSSSNDGDEKKMSFLKETIQ